MAEAVVRIAVQWGDAMRNVSLSCPLTVRIYVTFLYSCHKLTHAQDWLPRKWIPYTVVFGWPCVLADGSGSWIGQTRLNASTHTHTHTRTPTCKRRQTESYTPLIQLWNCICFNLSPILQNVFLKKKKLPHCQTSLKATSTPSCTTCLLTTAQNKLRLCLHFAVIWLAAFVSFSVKFHSPQAWSVISSLFLHV